MTQRSQMYVVYRVISRDDKGNTATREYATTFMDRDDSDKRMVENEVPSTIDQRKARVFDKKEAFQYALRAGWTWTPGELVSDAKGVHVEE